MTLPPYTRTRDGEVPQLGSGPTPCRLSFGVRKCSQTVKNVLTFLHEPVLRIPETVGKGYGFIAHLLSAACAIFECLLLTLVRGKS